MKPDQIIRIIFRSRQIMDDLTELNSLDKQLDDLRTDQQQVTRDIANHERLILQGVSVPLIALNRRDDIQAGINKANRMKRALEEKIRLRVRCELSSSEQRGYLLLEGAKKFYHHFKNNPITDGELYVPRYDAWAEDLLNESLKIGFHDAEVYFLLGSICKDTERTSDAHDYFVESVEYDESYVKALEAKIEVSRILIKEGEDWRKADLLRDEERLEKLLSDDSEVEI